MSWQGIIGHDAVALQFARANQRGRLGGSFLFVGSEGIGKASFAFALAKTLLCQKQKDPPSVGEVRFERAEDLDFFLPCEECPSCRQFVFSDPAGIPQHPDFHYVCKDPDKTRIPLELLIGGKMCDGLCADISKTPFLGWRKIAIINDADSFNQEGANALLKTLEEPPPNALILLIGTSTAKQLPTIRSRCQIIRFQDPDARSLAELLEKRQKVSSMEEGLKRVKDARGSLTRSEVFEDDSLSEFCGSMFRNLSAPGSDSVELARMVNEFVDAAGKEAQVRRKRLRNILFVLLDWYRDLLYLRSGGDENRINIVLREHYRSALNDTDRSSAESLIRATEKTLEALNQIDRNINISLITDSLFDELYK